MKKALRALELLLILVTSYFWGAVVLAAETAYVREETRDCDCRVFRILWHVWNIFCYMSMPIYTIVCMSVGLKRTDLFKKCLSKSKKYKVNYFTLYNYKWWWDIFHAI